MTRHIERFKIDLERLIKQGDELQLCMNKEVDKAGVFKAKFEAQIGKERTEELFKNFLSSELHMNLGIRKQCPCCGNCCQID